MAFKIIITDKAEYDLINIAEFIEEKWSKADADNFIGKVEDFVKVLEKFPHVGVVFNQEKNIRFFVVTSQVRLYYRVRVDAIVLLTFFDTRQNPKKLKL